MFFSTFFLFLRSVVRAMALQLNAMDVQLEYS